MASALVTAGVVAAAFALLPALKRLTVLGFCWESQPCALLLMTIRKPVTRTGSHADAVDRCVEMSAASVSLPLLLAAGPHAVLSMVTLCTGPYKQFKSWQTADGCDILV